jgi:hypothetical protein
MKKCSCCGSTVRREHCGVYQCIQSGCQLCGVELPIPKSIEAKRNTRIDKSRAQLEAENAELRKEVEGLRCKYESKCEHGNQA